MAKGVYLLSLLAVLSTTVGAIPSAGGSNENAAPVLRRDDPVIPFLDYDGIAAASEAAVADDLQRRGIIDYLDEEKRNAVPRCSKVNVRKEWRTLSKSDQKSYMKAVKCLYNKPDYGISNISNTMYDAFTYIHENAWFRFHACAPFAPWHRWFVWLRETTMRDMCGYTGPFPYWNFTTDYQNPFGASLFSGDPDVGFGSHGSTPYEAIEGAWGYKVEDGAFAGLKVNLPEPHYLTRNFSFWKTEDPTHQYGTAFGDWFGPSYLKKTLQANTFWDFETILDGLNAPLSLGIHNGLHFNQNSDWSGPAWLVNTTWYPWASTAPNDPMFFPHHAYVDAVFWQWQQQPGKQYLYGGSTNFLNLTQNDATATDTLPFSGFGPDVPVALALKTENWPLCYTYDH